MTEITRSTEATGGAEAGRVARQRRALPNGWWAMALLVATEFTLFGSLIATYFYLRFQSGTWPPAGIDPPSVTRPLILTGVLVASCVPMLGAVRASRRGRSWVVWALVVLALVIQGAYLGFQIDQLVGDLGTFSPTQTAYGSIYFTLLGLHHAHVAVGLLLDAWLLAVLPFGLTNYRSIALRVVALYWYFIAFTAVLVVLTQLYPSL